MKKTTPRRSYRISNVSSFVILLLITLSLMINPLAAIAASNARSSVVKSASLEEHETVATSGSTSEVQPSPAGPLTVFTNAAAINIPDDGVTGTTSTIAVSGLVGPIASVTVTLNNYTTPRPQQVDFLLVGPGGQKFIIVSDVGGTGVGSVSNNINLTLSDAGATLIGQNPGGAQPLVSGTFKPSDYDASVNFPTSAPPYQSPAPLGAATFTTVFGGLSGASVNGNWVLHAFDSSAGSGTSTVAGGWSIDVVTTAAAPTTTTLMSSANPSLTTQAITLTSTTTSTSTVNTGVVDFFDNTTATLLCNDAPVNGSGQATCNVPGNTLSERIHNITATYVGNATFATSNGSINQTVNCPTTGASPTFTNGCGVTIPDAGSPTSAIPYPSNIVVSGLAGTISKVTLTLTNTTLPVTSHFNFLLVGPGGQNYVFMSDTGGNVASTGVNITLDDAAATQLPNSGSIATGTYRPADYNVDSDPFPAPAPVPTNFAAPNGSATFASVYGGLAPNGTWSLFASDDTGGGANGTIGSWSLTFTTSGDAPTTTVVSGNPNPAFTTQAVLMTANVTSTSTVNAGTVTFRRGATIICAAVPVVSGVATCNAAAGTLPESDILITADYSGAPGQFNLSSGNYTQIVMSPTVKVGTNFANNGGITINDASSATPYPSRILVTGLGGTITKVTVSLNNINNISPDHMDLLLVGPGGQKFLFMGDAGGTVDMVGVNLILDDAAATALPDSTAITSGTYRPTAYTGDPDVFPAPAPAGPYNPAAPEGAGTFALFNGISPLGMWSLYAVEDTGDATNVTIGSWSLTFTLAPAATTTAVSSSANPSVFGQPVTFTATVSTAGLGTPTGNVQFFDGASPIGGPVALNGSGQAQVTTSSLSVGNHTITVNYAGDVPNGFNASSGSLAGGQTVNKANTTTGLTSNQSNPVGTNIPVTFTATVSPVAPGAGTRTGTVTFSRNGSPVCSNVAINGAGQATCTITFTLAGNYNITASYSGDTNFNASSTAAPFVQQVVGPTAANVSVSGRVIDTEGRGVSGARVAVQNQAGDTLWAITNPFGYYRVDGVGVGETYLVSVQHKRYVFQPRALTVNDELTDVDFIAEGERPSEPAQYDEIKGSRRP